MRLQRDYYVIRQMGWKLEMIPVSSHQHIQLERLLAHMGGPSFRWMGEDVFLYIRPVEFVPNKPWYRRYL